jgi:hypothetical protein
VTLHRCSKSVGAVIRSRYLNAGWLASQFLTEAGDSSRARSGESQNMSGRILWRGQLAPADWLTLPAGSERPRRLTLEVVITHVTEERPGRNDPCHCGSGKKYKRCCEGADQAAESAARRRAASVQQFSYEAAPPEILAIRDQVEQRQRGVREKLARDFGVLINFVTPVDVGGRKVWSIGNRVYTDRPPKQTFHEFMLQLLRETFGEEWRSANKTGEPEHYLYRCFREYGAWTTRMSRLQEPDAAGLWSVAPNGWAQYLRSVAWDVASLLHATARRFPEPLLARLRDPAAFQGARYELAVAALFARLDCAIEFLDDAKLRDRKHAEFIATHRPSGQEFAVEAKSRHREGVINQPGEFCGNDPLRGDRRMVRTLFKKALEKDVGGLPYFIFIDINAPAEPLVPGLEPAWQSGIRAWMDRFPAPTAAEPATYNSLYVTNFSPQYEGAARARGGEWLSVRPKYASSIPNVGLTDQIDYALDRFDKVPEIGVDGAVC